MKNVGFGGKKKDKSPHPGYTTMEGMIYHANQVCNSALDPATMGVPRRLLEGCHGVVLISVVEAGFIFSGNVGTGVVMTHDPATGKWSPPSAIAMAGIGWGLLVGAEVKDIMIVLVDELARDTLTGDGQVKLGGQLGVTAGPVGREVEGAFNFSNQGAGITFTYSYSRGLFAGVGLEGAVLTVRNKENDRFYSQHGTTAHGILLENQVKIPEGSGIETLHSKLDLMKQGKTLTQDDRVLVEQNCLRVTAEQAAILASDYQEDEVEYVEAEEQAKKERRALTK